MADETRLTRMLLWDFFQGVFLVLTIQVCNTLAQKAIEVIQDFLKVEGSPVFDFFSVVTDVMFGLAGVATLAAYMYKSGRQFWDKLHTSPKKKSKTRTQESTGSGARKLPKSKAHPGKGGKS